MADEADMAADIVADLVARGLVGIKRAIPTGVAGECDGCGETMPRLVGGLCGFCRDGRRPPLSFYDADRPARVVAPAPAPRPWIPSDQFTSPAGGTLRSGQDDVRGEASRTPPVPEASPQPESADRASPANVAAPPPATVEPEMTAPDTDEKQLIGVPASGAVLKAIRDRATERDLPLGRAGLSLLEDALLAELSRDPTRHSVQGEVAAPVLDSLTPEEVLANVSHISLLAELTRRLKKRVACEDYDAAIARAEEAEGKLATLRGLLG